MGNVKRTSRAKVALSITLGFLTAKVFKPFFGNTRIDWNWVKCLPQYCGKTRNLIVCFAGQTTFRFAAADVAAHPILGAIKRLTASAASARKGEAGHMFSEIQRCTRPHPHKWVGKMNFPHSATTAGTDPRTLISILITLTDYYYSVFFICDTARAAWTKCCFNWSIGRLRQCYSMWTGINRSPSREARPRLQVFLDGYIVCINFHFLGSKS